MCNEVGITGLFALNKLTSKSVSWDVSLDVKKESKSLDAEGYVLTGKKMFHGQPFHMHLAFYSLYPDGYLHRSYLDSYIARK